MSYQFTQDWFTRSVDNFNQAKSCLRERKKILEIGSFEGRSTVWLVEHMLDDYGFITCIDTWGGSKEHGSMDVDMKVVEENFDTNVNILARLFTTKMVHKKKTSSVDGIVKELSKDAFYDFIYIDGSHEAKDCLTDAVLSWNLLKPKGVMIFDDYTWDVIPGEIHRPRMAIDAFLAIFADALDVLFINHQVGVQKK